MHQSIALLFVLNILGVQSRAQFRQGLDDSLGLDALPNGNCICTPFYRCYDDQPSNDLNGIVGDRVTIRNGRPVMTVIQDGLGACPDVLDICCRNLVPASPTPTTNPEGSSCQDQHASCAGWGSRGECERNLAFMLENCPRTCKSCPPTNLSPHVNSGQSTASNGACGVRNSNGVGFSVEGFNQGQAQYGEFPWMVALLTVNTGFGSDLGARNLFVGGGSLIDPQVVLTAAHKIFDEDSKTLTVRVGEWNFRTSNEPTLHQDIPVRQVIYHPRFNRGRMVNNYALLVLEQPAELGETVRTICLPSNPSQRFDGQQCLLSGWGQDVYGEEGRYQRIMKLVNVNMVEHFQCQSAIQNAWLARGLGNSFTLDNSFICAGDQGQDACTGDGGSPLVCPDPTSPGQYVQVGITSWGIECGVIGIPGVYAAVAPEVNWIQDTLNTIRATAA